MSIIHINKETLVNTNQWVSASRIIQSCYSFALLLTFFTLGLVRINYDANPII